MKDVTFKFGVLIIYIILFVLFVLVGKYAPFCPKDFLNHIASEIFCSCYLWNVVAYESIIIASIISILFWSKVSKVSYPLAIFPSVVFFILVAFGDSASAINGWIGAIGPDTIISTSVYALPSVIIISTLLYCGLIVLIVKNITSRRKFWIVLFLALFIYGAMSVLFLSELYNYLYQFGRG